MEIYEGKGITFYLKDNRIYFKTPLQTMRLTYPNANKSFSTQMGLIRTKIRSGDIATVRALYIHLGEKVSCIYTRLP